MKVNDALSKITIRLKSEFGITNGKASARVYRDNEAFARQLSLNTKYLAKLRQSISDGIINSINVSSL